MLTGGSDPLTYISRIIILVMAISVHEFAHALTANWLGDPTPRSQGRLTLDPRRHLDPFGSIMFLIAGFGWGKPVPVNEAYLRVGGWRGMALVSLAGPVSNIVAASLFSVPLRAGAVGSTTQGHAVFSGTGADIAAYVLVSLVFWNLLLAAFNLLPVAPLDGFKIALGVLPPEAACRFACTDRRDGSERVPRSRTSTRSWPSPD